MQLKHSIARGPLFKLYNVSFHLLFSSNVSRIVQNFNYIFLMQECAFVKLKNFCCWCWLYQRFRNSCRPAACKINTECRQRFSCKFRQLNYALWIHWNAGTDFELVHCKVIFKRNVCNWAHNFTNCPSRKVGKRDAFETHDDMKSWPVPQLNSPFKHYC